jgi:hypothetical protein
MAGQVVLVSAEAPPPAWAHLCKKRKQGSGASQKTNTRQGPCSANVRSRGRGLMKVKTNRVLLYVDAGHSDELPLVVRQSFKDGLYSPSISMEEMEW